MEKEIKIAAKLYDIRATAKKFLGKDYEDRIKPYKDLVKSVMKEHKIEAANALLKISESEAYKSEGIAQMMFVAATTDLMEE